jgi:pantoate--beta-alanine ligase
MREAYQQQIPLEQIEQQAIQVLEQAGFDVDYVEILSANLGKASRSNSKQRVALIAARLGRTRLIDNLEFDIA